MLNPTSPPWLLSSDIQAVLLLVAWSASVTVTLMKLLIVSGNEYVLVTEVLEWHKEGNRHLIPTDRMMLL